MIHSTQAKPIRFNQQKIIPIHDTVAIGDEAVVLMAGPCSVESYSQMTAVATSLTQAGIQIMRGGAFKPRTSPHSFQGLGEAGLDILSAIAKEYGLLIITEALAVAQLPQVAEVADIIQLGSRNMQHYPLLWAVGELNKPVLLKRGFMSTIDEWLKAAEHIASRGNEQIILCERGIRTFETTTRNTLDTNSISLVKQISPFPVIADPSHATGRADLVIPAARAAIAAGADGLLVEFHPQPTEALSDGAQSLPLTEMPRFVHEVGRIATALERPLQ